jgi:hypothetical protein
MMPSVEGRGTSGVTSTLDSKTFLKRLFAGVAST